MAALKQGETRLTQMLQIAGMKDDTTRRGQDIHAETAREALNGRMETAKFIQKSIAERLAAGAASKQELAEYVQGELDKRQVYGFDRKEDIAKMVQDALNMRQETGLAAKASEGALNRGAAQERVDTQQAGADYRAELGAKTRTDIAANKPPSATEIKITNQAQRYDVATQTIDDAFKDIKTAFNSGSGLSPTGAGGRARSLSGGDRHFERLFGQHGCQPVQAEDRASSRRGSSPSHRRCRRLHEQGRTSAGYTHRARSGAGGYYADNRG